MKDRGVLVRKVLLRMYRLVLRAATVLRCPAVLRDPTALVCRLWPPQAWPVDPDPDPECDAERSSGSSAGSHRAPTRLLVIVPFRDKWPLTQAALDSLVAQRGHGLSIEVALVDNGSAAETMAHLSQWLERHGAPATMSFRLLRFDIPFNFSKLNNLAYAACTTERRPDYLLLLNNDVVLTDGSTLRRFLLRSRALGPRMGAMGCTLLYRDGRVQHSFVAPGVVLVGAHPLKRVPFKPHYAWFQGTQRVPAITGALFWLPAGVFAQVGGFDEDLPTAYQDVDLCLKITTAGYQIFCIADLTAIHDESATRTALPSLEEADHIYRKWGPALTAHPEVPRELSRWSEHPTLRLAESEFPWRWLYQ
jgi:GT2 family glycosyltransferase